MENVKKSKWINPLWIWSLILIIGQPIVYAVVVAIFNLISPSIILNVCIYGAFLTPITIFASLIILLYVNAVKGKFVGFREWGFEEIPQRKIILISVIVALVYSFLNWHLYHSILPGAVWYDLWGTVKYAGWYVLITATIIAVILIVNLTIAWNIAKRNQPNAKSDDFEQIEE